VTEQATLQSIPIAAIHPSPYQYRTRFDDEKQHQLLESLRANGQSAPILVRPRGGEFELVSGERRWRAAKELGWDSIRAVCEEMTDDEAAARVVTENEVRSDANIMEKAAGYKKLTEPPCGFSFEEIARRYGWGSGTSVKRLVDLLDQPQAIQEFLSRDRIGESHMRFLSRIKDLTARVKMAKRAADEGWSSRMTEQQVAKLLSKAHKKSRKCAEKPAPDDGYIYNHFHCALISNEVEVSGRRFKKDEEMLDEYVSAFRTAIQCFLRDLADRAGAANASPIPSELVAPMGPNTTLLPVAPPPPTPPAAPTTNEATVDVQKEAANFKSAGQSLRDLLAEISPKKPATDVGANPEEQAPAKVSNS